MLDENNTGIDQSVSAVLEKLPAEGQNPALVLQYLIQIQQAFNYVPGVAIKTLSNRLNLGIAHIRGLISFYTFLHETPRGHFDILFSDNITDRMLGSTDMMARLCLALGAEPGVPHPTGLVTVGTTSCTGMCDQGPALLVNHRAITRLTTSRIDQIAALIEQRTPIDLWPADFFRIDDNIHRKDLLLSHPLEKGAAIAAAWKMGSESVLDQLELSGLCGRGGAGFSTAVKWRFCKQAEAKQRYVVCNADEGEPGTFKDRVLLTRFAHEMVEGMTVCAAVVGAQKGFIYLRGEYLHLVETLHQVLAERREAGLLGARILGEQTFEFDIHIHLGASAYICGEESALIESLEGKRGIPRNRPPFPVEKGYRQQPTVVNNVETFVAAAQITLYGSDWFRAKGTGRSTGTKLISVSGDCAKPGIYEFPFGVSIKDILEACEATDTQAVQVAGAAGVTVPKDEFHRTIAFEDIPTGGSFMVFNASRSMLDMVQNFSQFFVHESCGFCTPCRVGGGLLNQLVSKVTEGRASEYDLKEMRGISSTMQQTSHCGLGSTASNAVRDTLDKMPEIYSNKLIKEVFEPAFDLDAALGESRRLTGRDDPDAHLEGSA